MRRTLKDIANSYDNGEMNEEEFIASVILSIRQLSDPNDIGKLADTLMEGDI